MDYQEDPADAHLKNAPQNGFAENKKIREEKTPILTPNNESYGDEKISDDISVEGVNDTESTGIQTYRRRWAMLLLFMFYSVSNAYQWIHINIIQDVTIAYYNESIPGDSLKEKGSVVDWLSMLYMLAYIPLIFPASWLLDKKGLRIACLIGSAFNATGAWLKVGAVSPARFWLLLLAQTFCAIAQVFVLGIPAQLAATWFGPEQVSTATAIGVFGNQLGVGLGFVIPPYVISGINKTDMEAVGSRLSYMYYGGAALTTTLFGLIVLTFQERPPNPPSQAQLGISNTRSDEGFLYSLKSLVTNVPFTILLITYGLNTGSFYAIGTLLNPIILYSFQGSDNDDLSSHVGWMGLSLVIAGMAGSVVAGLWLDKTRLFKYTTIGMYLFALGGMLLLTFTLALEQIWLCYLCVILLGFFMTGYLPVGFEFAAELTYPVAEGTSSGLLNASSQIFGIILTLTMGEIIRGQDSSDSIRTANLCVCGVLLIGAIGTATIKNVSRRQDAETQKTFGETELLSSDELNNTEDDLGSQKLA